MNKRDYRYTITVVGVIFIWVILLFFCIYKPLTNNIAQMNEQIWQNNKELEEMNNFVLLHNNDLTVYQKQLATNLSVIKQKIPTDLVIDETLQKINQIAQDTNMIITSLKIQPAKKYENILVQDIDISLKGDYFSILAFLRGLNLSSRTIIVKQGKMITDNDSLKCNLTLQIYADNYNK